MSRIQLYAFFEGVALLFPLQSIQRVVRITRVACRAASRLAQKSPGIFSSLPGNHIVVALNIPRRDANDKGFTSSLICTIMAASHLSRFLSVSFPLPPSLATARLSPREETSPDRPAVHLPGIFPALFPARVK